MWGREKGGGRGWGGVGWGEATVSELCGVGEKSGGIWGLGRDGGGGGWVVGGGGGGGGDATYPYVTQPMFSF